MHIAFLLLLATTAHADKTILHTSWWPPGTEKNSESVGVKSGELIYATGMMERNFSSNATWTPAGLAQELRDVGDIFANASANLSNLVSCLVNAPTTKGAAGAVNAALHAIGKKSGLKLTAVTMVPMQGEFGGWFGVQLSCLASTAPPSKRFATTVTSPSGLTNVTAVAAGSLVHLSVEEFVYDGVDIINVELLSAVENAMYTVGAYASWNGLLECTAFVNSEQDAKALRQGLTAAALPAAAPAITTLVLLDQSATAPTDGLRLRLRCTGLVTPGAPKTAVTLPNAPSVRAVVSASTGHVFVSGIDAKSANATDAYETLGEVLTKAGSTADLATKCHFYLRDYASMQGMYAGFYSYFNEQHFPPPARTEFTRVASEAWCADCPMVVQCDAAMSS